MKAEPVGAPLPVPSSRRLFPMRLEEGHADAEHTGLIEPGFQPLARVSFRIEAAHHRKTLKKADHGLDSGLVGTADRRGGTITARSTPILSTITISSLAPSGSGRCGRAPGTETKDSLPIWSAGQGLSDR